MDRTACVDLPAFPLQLLYRRHPDWKSRPVVVVAEDAPQAEILWANRKARAHRILPGHRYAHALSLASELRAGMVTAEEIAAGVDLIVTRLRAFSPEVESGADVGAGEAAEPGVFWLDASGLERLYPSLTAWARSIRADLASCGFGATVVVGFSRFGTYAIAQSEAVARRARQVTIFDTPEDERVRARTVPLEALGIPPKLRDALARLGVTTVGAFVGLPAGGILRRFGREAHRLHQLAAGERWNPLAPRPPEPRRAERVLLDDAERDTERLLFVIKSALDRLLALLAARKRALAVLHLTLQLDTGGTRPVPASVTETLRPAEPSLDGRALLRLLHLRLEARPPPAGVVEVEISAEDVAATREQLSLFAQRPRRDVRAGQEAVARLRAELGNDAVLRAVVRDGHLPEARYGWEPCTEIVLARLDGGPGNGPEDGPGDSERHGEDQERQLVRRIYARPLLLPPQSHHVRDDGWILAGLAEGAVERVQGPYIVSGGWWMSEVHREYHFAETRKGACLWVYYDRRRRRWFLHGQVQ